MFKTTRSEIEQQTDFKASCFKIVNHLRLLRSAHADESFQIQQLPIQNK